MQIQITLTGTNWRENAQALRGLADAWWSETTQTEDTREEKSDIDVSELKKGRGRPKKEAAATTTTEETESDDDLDFGDVEEDEEETPVKKEKPIELSTVISAFQAFVKENSREAAAKLLGKYKVKSVRELPADKYKEVLKTLKA